MSMVTSLLDRRDLALVILGLLMFLVAAAGQVPLPTGRVVIAPPWDYGTGGLGVICLLVGMALVVSEHRKGTGLAQSALPDRFGQQVVMSGYARSHIPEFYAAIEQRIGTARQVKFISMGLQILRMGKILDILVDRAARGATEVIACMGNPYSPDVVDRLVEEEMSDAQPQIGRHGIERNVRSLLDHLDTVRNPPNFRVLLFEHYPTFGTYVIDQDIFLVPYTYQLLGWQAPVMHLKDDGHSEIARFFVEHADRMLRDAVPARDVFDGHPDRRQVSDVWIQACVAIVPDSHEALYRFGSDIVGYDLRRATRIATTVTGLADLAHSVGDAGDGGFYAPVVDPLYFPNEAAIRRVAAELTILSDELPRFSLLHPRIEDRLHTMGDIAVRCDDNSGVVEALHGELVSRVYRRAVASAFQVAHGQRGLTGPVAGRSDLMIRRYGSPRVLSRFGVHFPLCSDPPLDPVARKGLRERLEELCRERVPLEPIVIDRVHLLVKRPADAHWHVHKVYRLN